MLPENEKKVNKPVKSLYSLKQAPKQWHEKFDFVVLSNGLSHNSAERCSCPSFLNIVFYNSEKVIDEATLKVTGF